MLAVPTSVLKPSIQMLLVSAVCAATCHMAIAAEQRPAPRPAATAQSEKPADTKPAAAKEAVQPQCDVDCIKKATDAAAQACAPLIEAKAPIDYDWLARPFGGIFQQAEPSAETSLVRYRGDTIRFLTPQSQWTRVSYECGYDVAKAAVTFVNVRVGRLDRPATAAVERTNDPAQAGNPQRQPPQQPQFVGQQGPGPQGSLAAGQPAANGAKPPMRYGEPSAIDISQVPARR